MTPQQVQDKILKLMGVVIEDRARKYGDGYRVSLDSSAIFAYLGREISRGRVVYALRQLVDSGAIVRLGKATPRYTLAKS